ncbi:MAG: hypothetical protein RL090_440 [Bacteroidota bacterium]|jgi:hypothetical protein
MTALYRFRVSFEDYDDIHRDIDIRSTQTFLEFHHSIQKAIGFDASKPASFYMSNDNWKKGQEIRSTIEGSNTRGDFKTMDDARLCDFIADPHQKIYYVSDPSSQWTFLIELVRIHTDGDKNKEFPLCVKSTGDAPKQYPIVDIPKGGVPDPENVEDLLMADIFADGEENEEEIIGEEEEEESGEALGDGVDEEEYDDIEESSEEDSERE